MKINIDSICHTITDVETDKVLIKLDCYAFQSLINKILNPTQQTRLVNSDGIYTISKKAVKILLNKIEETK